MTKRQLAIVATAAVWLVVTVLFWVGYTGEDDLMYARYAYLFHRAPIVWWEFRMPEIRWRETHPNLKGWAERMESRPSFRATPIVA